MHLRLLIASTIICSSLNASEVQPVFNLNPNIHLTIQSNNAMQATNTSELGQAVHLPTQMPLEYFKNAQDIAKAYGQGAFTWIAHNKLKTTAFVAATSYCYVWYTLLSLNYQLSQSTRWSQWHNSLTLEELLKKPQEEVATDLLTDIQRTYTNVDRLENVIAPLIAFVHDVDTEIEQLKQVVKLHAWIDRLYIAFLFPKQADLLASAQESINRLSYLKNVMLTWVSDHKMMHLAQGHAFAA